MTNLWLASYIILWLLVGTLLLITIGLLQQLGLLQQQLKQYGPKAATEKEVLHPSLEDDGPAIGTTLPDMAVSSINGFGSLMFSVLPSEDYRLLMFLSPFCESCQHVIESLNMLVKDNKDTGKVIAIMRADEHGCRAFTSVFPLNLPVVCDSERTIAMNFNVHYAPFGLLYNAQGTLISKGGIKNKDDLLFLLRNVVQLER